MDFSIFKIVVRSRIDTKVETNLGNYKFEMSYCLTRKHIKQQKYNHKLTARQTIK